MSWGNNEMMEDSMSEGTMMDCASEGEGLDEPGDLASDISDTVPHIRDAAERLLTLLVDNDDEYDSSEDEGVELDLDELDELAENSMLLRQLASSLVQELKLSETSTPLNSPPVSALREKIHHMELSGEDVGCQLAENRLNSSSCHPYGNLKRQNYEERMAYAGDKGYLSEKTGHKRCRIDNELRENTGNERRCVSSADLLGHWAAGWEACASEAISYLLEIEGLDPQHPKVLNLKNHLQGQKDRAFAQHSMSI